jgi:hypothetical protein
MRPAAWPSPHRCRRGLPAITFGTAADGNLPGNVAFYDIVIKEEAVVDYGFLDAPDQYSSVAQFPPQDAPRPAMR